MERYLLDIIAARKGGPLAAVLRSALSAAEIPYSAAIRLRNHLYDAGLFKSASLPKRTISVGNLTTGGSGKTPLVCWLSEKAIAAGRVPAVLMRGYRGHDGASDEQTLIANAFSSMTVVANPDRRKGAFAALATNPNIDLFILDDAMQHRQVRRDVEIVLIDAANPWGWNHVLPRGLLREPKRGLDRADAIVLTRCSMAATGEIEKAVRRYNEKAVLLRSNHVLSGLLAAGRVPSPMSMLSGTPYIATCGIAQPESFVASLNKFGQCAGTKFFADHHHFTEVDIASLQALAKENGAKAIVVTEKDWVKLAQLPAAMQSPLPFLRAQLRLEFLDDSSPLLDMVLKGKSP